MHNFKLAFTELHCTALLSGTRHLGLSIIYISTRVLLKTIVVKFQILYKKDLKLITFY